MIEASDGVRGVALAREAIDARPPVPGPGRDASERFRAVPLPTVFEERRGLFVTLTEAASGRLRGCIGFPLPVFPLRSGIPRAAWAAAVDDPRFPSVSLGELSRTLIELSILTVPQELSVRDGATPEVVVGRDGLIVDRGGFEGLLLPQVAAEEGWGSERFLAETCRKAGLPPDAWKRPGTRVRGRSKRSCSERRARALRRSRTLSRGSPRDRGARERDDRSPESELADLPRAEPEPGRAGLPLETVRGSARSSSASRRRSGAIAS